MAKTYEGPEEDITRNRHGGADTSEYAFTSTPAERRREQRRKIVALIKARRGGFTSEEVSMILDIPYTAASARMSELKRDGEIKDGGERRLTTHGKPARVMVLA